MAPTLPCLPVRDHGPEPHLTLAGTVRRLQALAYIGHGTPELAARLSVTERTVRWFTRDNPASLGAISAPAVAALYDELWDVPGDSAKTAHMARRLDWCPPLAWDDDNEDGHGIDDPAAAPADWKPCRPTLADKVENIHEVMTLGVTRQDAAFRLGIARETLNTLLWRAERELAS